MAEYYSNGLARMDLKWARTSGSNLCQVKTRIPREAMYPEAIIGLHH